ncbi:MAG: hypothetical protein AB1630_10555 [bacterium]
MKKLLALEVQDGSKKICLTKYKNKQYHINYDKNYQRGDVKC